MAKVYGNRWETIRSLDEGGQGLVYLVGDRQQPGTQYALKRLKDDRRVGRFEREIKAVSRISHPGIIRLVDHAVELPNPYYVMEYMAGGTLAGRVGPYKGDIRRSLDLVARICSVIGAAHEAKVCHRDLKPANILFRSTCDDTPVVADFGICWMEDGQEFTASGEVAGARFFTAPEIENGSAKEFAPEADAYSIGKILYYAITGGKALPREDHRGPGLNLREIAGPPDRRSLDSVQLDYVAELLDHLLDPNPSSRWCQMDAIANEVSLRRRLVGEGHYPVTAADGVMPCKLCGRGFYSHHGPRPFKVEGKHVEEVGSGPGQRAFREKIWALGVALYECSYCGHLQVFGWEAFQRATGAEEVA